MSLIKRGKKYGEILRNTLDISLNEKVNQLVKSAFNSQRINDYRFNELGVVNSFAELGRKTINWDLYGVRESKDSLGVVIQVREVTKVIPYLMPRIKKRYYLISYGKLFKKITVLGVSESSVNYAIQRKLDVVSACENDLIFS